MPPATKYTTAEIVETFRTKAAQERLTGVILNTSSAREHFNARAKVWDEAAAFLELHGQ